MIRLVADTAWPPRSIPFTYQARRTRTRARVDKRTRSVVGVSATCAQTWLRKAIYVAASLLRKDQGWRGVGGRRGCEGREGSVARDGTGAL